MPEQMTLQTSTALGAEWLDTHTKAEEFLAGRARYVNRATGKPARIAPLMEQMLSNPRLYALDQNDDGSPYLVSRNLWPEIARELEARFGVRFSKRRSKSDASYTAATP